MSGYRILLLVAGACLAPAGVTAQATTLTVTGMPVSFASPTAADFVAGSIQASGAATYTLEAAKTGASTQRTAILGVRYSSRTGTATLQWRRGDLVNWTTLGATDQTVESVVLRKGEVHTNTIAWRYLLSWTADSPGTTSYGVVLTMTITVP